MSNWPISVPGGIRAAVSSAVTFNSGVAPNYSAWQQLVASIPQGVVGVVLHRMNLATNGAVELTFQLALGSAGNERVIVEPIWVSSIQSNNSTSAQSIFLPISLPAGERLSISASRAVSAQSAVFRVEFIFGSGLYPLGGSRIATFGFDPSTQVSTTLTAGASGTWGTSVQVSASTPLRASALAIGGFGGQNGVALRGLVGAFYGTSDVLCGPAVAVCSSATGNTVIPAGSPLFLPCNIPRGSDIRLRLLHETAATPARNFSLHLVF